MALETLGQGRKGLGEGVSQHGWPPIIWIWVQTLLWDLDMKDAIMSFLWEARGLSCDPCYSNPLVQLSFNSANKEKAPVSAYLRILSRAVYVNMSVYVCVCMLYMEREARTL